MTDATAPVFVCDLTRSGRSNSSSREGTGSGQGGNALEQFGVVALFAVVVFDVGPAHGAGLVDEHVGAVGVKSLVVQNPVRTRDVAPEVRDELRREGVLLLDSFSVAVASTLIGSTTVSAEAN